MKSSTRIKTILFALLLVLLIPVYVQAAGSNNLTVVKLLNTSDHYINEKPVDGTSAVEGSTYRIWWIGDGVHATSQQDYDRMLRDLGQHSLEELDAMYPEPAAKLSEPTDVNGETTFANLEDGRYYIQEVVIKDGMTTTSEYSVPFIVDLPLLVDGEALTEVTVYPKSTEPKEPEEPEKPFGGEKFIKVDSRGKTLAGARFKVVDRVQDDEGRDIRDASGNYVYEDVLKDGKRIILLSDENGRFEVDGLPYGVYWLVETAAPRGYRLLTEPLEFAVTKTSYDDPVTVQIVNQDGPPPPDQPDSPDKPKNPIVIPQTGDIEFILLLVAGFAMVILGAWITKDTQVD